MRSLVKTHQTELIRFLLFLKLTFKLNCPPWRWPWMIKLIPEIVLPGITVVGSFRPICWSITFDPEIGGHLGRQLEFKFVRKNVYRSHQAIKKKHIIKKMDMVCRMGTMGLYNSRYGPLREKQSLDVTFIHNRNMKSSLYHCWRPHVAVSFYFKCTRI